MPYLSSKSIFKSCQIHLKITKFVARCFFEKKKVARVV